MRSLLAVASLAVLLLLCAVSTVTARGPKWHQLSPNYHFDMYCRHFGKYYGEPTEVEYGIRKMRFEDELHSILKHNSQAGVNYKRGVNQFSDMSEDEIRKKMMFNTLTSKATPGSMKAQPNHHHGHAAANTKLDNVRGSVDYRNSVPAVLTSVKDQGDCGSCWSHGVTESIESYTALKTGQLEALSQQQLVSCVPVHNMNLTVGNMTYVDPMHGCDGYMPNLAFDFLVNQQKGDMFTEWQFPYTSYFHGENTNISYTACRNPSNKTASPLRSPKNDFTNVTGHTRLPVNDQNAILNHLSNEGPLVTIMYCPKAFMSYESGVFDNEKCVGYSDMQPSHVILLVGYGFDDDVKKPYWILRNSWNTNWGENGYFRLIRTDPEVCGYMALPNRANSAFVNQTACGTCGIESFTLYPEIGVLGNMYGQ